MTRSLIVMLLSLLITAPAVANTKNGTTSQNLFQRWRFTAAGGDITVTITWSNRNVSSMVHVITCGSGGPTYVAVASTSTHDRINSSTTGIRAELACTIFVRTRGQPTELMFETPPTLG